MGVGKLGAMGRREAVEKRRSGCECRKPGFRCVSDCSRESAVVSGGVYTVQSGLCTCVKNAF